MSDLLLDTHALLWWVLDDSRLPARARRSMADTDRTVFVSVASIWEIAIKFGRGRLPEAGDFVRMLGETGGVPGFATLEINATHAVRGGLLEFEHRDPFDRILIAQALSENLELVSNERLFDRTGVRRIWA